MTNINTIRAMVTKFGAYNVTGEQDSPVIDQLVESGEYEVVAEDDLHGQGSYMYFIIES